MSRHPFIPYSSRRKSQQEMEESALAFLHLMQSRRSIRDFSCDPVPRRLIEIAIETASSAPSGAHRQPWRFVAVGDPKIKRQIRLAAEKEEKKNYSSRMPIEWLEAVEPLGTNWRKPFLELVPWIVVVFAESYGWSKEPEPRKLKNYYVQESVGIACGLFIAALHTMGLATLTHTPSPMNFLSEILKRPANERPYLLFPVGYPAPEARVPALRRKSLDEVTLFCE